ncbi:MAG TPA: tetratricopeptide repeat protein [Geobacteraceae bacterium]
MLILSFLILCGFTPGTVDYYVAYAQTQVATGKIADAFATLAKAIDLDPRAPSPYASRAFLYLKLGKRDEALADFSTVIALSPKAPDGYVSRAFVYLDVGEHEKAVADFDMACRLGDASGCAFLSETSGQKGP